MKNLLKVIFLSPHTVGFLKIPIIQRAKAMSDQEIKLFASPWSAPAWMKTNKMMHNGLNQGRLIGQPGEKYYKTWADYFIR